MDPRPTKVVGKLDSLPSLALLRSFFDIRGRRRSEPHPVGHRGGLAGAVGGYPPLLALRLHGAHLDP